MNAIDRVVGFFSPVAGLRRHQARRLLAYYEAGRPDPQRKQRRATGSGNDAVSRAGTSLREQARHLEQNYDLALGVLNTAVANIVGARGIGVEPQPRYADGHIDDELARQLTELWKDWGMRPEVTGQHDWASAQRLLCRSWLRDGECFSQVIGGTVRGLEHGARVPLSLEMLETDFVPLDLNGNDPTVRQGVEINAWGAPTAYRVFKEDPTSMLRFATLDSTKRIEARNMLHLATRHRIRQLRGVTVFASVMHRFDDLKDYEESERIAAKVAASMAAYIRKGSPDMYDADPKDGPRDMQLVPGMIFDDLRLGEEIGTIDTNRPNPNLDRYRQAQLRAIAAGTGPTFSAIARTYDGTYSSQRQELVEGFSAYGVLASEFIGRIVRPVYERFVSLAIASGAIRVPKGLILDSLDDAEFIAPQMPWIDPLKEASAWEKLEDRAYASGAEIVRRRGGNPADTIAQQARWLRAKQNAGIPAPPSAPEPELPEPDEHEEQTRGR